MNIFEKIFTKLIVALEELTMSKIKSDDTYCNLTLNTDGNNKKIYSKMEKLRAKNLVALLRAKERFLWYAPSSWEDSGEPVATAASKMVRYEILADKIEEKYLKG